MIPDDFSVTKSRSLSFSSDIPVCPTITRETHRPKVAATGRVDQPAGVPLGEPGRHFHGPVLPPSFVKRHPGDDRRVHLESVNLFICQKKGGFGERCTHEEIEYKEQKVKEKHTIGSMLHDLLKVGND